jgi:GDP-L-fucose synthase
MTIETVFSLEGRRVFVAGHAGMVGSAIVRRLSGERCEVLTVSRSEVDLRDQARTRAWMLAQRPDVVILAAARVGGILANTTYPVEFLHDNLMIEANVIESSYRAGVRKLLFLGSSCIYPKHAAQPMDEDALLSGPLEPTNQWYAIAKIAGIKLCQAYRQQHGCDFISGMPTNLYGYGDNFDVKAGHVLPALIRKAHDAKVSGAKELVIWGTGKPMREFLHVDDCADACITLLERYSAEGHINIGFGSDITIRALAELVCEVVGFTGVIVHDTSKPDGTPRKLINADRIRALGWAPKIGLREGIGLTYDAYCRNPAAFRGAA